jgi:CBS domain-containing protein
MASVGQLLRSKGNAVWSVTPDTTVYDAIKLMAQKEVGALLVLEGDKLMGIISERDYARKVILRGRSSKDTPVRDIMTERVLYVRPEQTIEECMALMTAKRVRHLPVCEDDHVIGVVSIGDLVKSVISQQEYLIQQLENYIAGR